ncbi:2,3-diphosphoglycerate-dependent phosphoglycerate mutase [Streptomyces sp. NPDC056983]|uniref:2,3-bisphosphoglycerate-dependent phosphoglycerate mutase n=1 Tax=Streptomyces sp. NPDC056983 TaxID=3345987 RepID=UPI003639C2C9
MAGGTVAPHRLVLLRHGESVWNAQDLFAGWADVPLTPRGRAQARRCGAQLADAGLLPDIAHTSLLKRAIDTADLALDAADRHWVDVRRSWRLNERHYGALQGRKRSQVRDEVGTEQLQRWRRSWDVAPPAVDVSTRYRDSEARYRQLGIPVPATESLKDVYARLVPYWENTVVPDLLSGRTVLVVAHGNVLRALVKHIDDLADDHVGRLKIPTGAPLHFRLDGDLRPLAPGGSYLSSPESRR